MQKLAAALCIFLVGQASAADWRLDLIPTIHPGAVVARRGLDSDWITQAVLHGSGNGRWSHVGVAVQLVTDGTLFILSAMPGAGTKLEKPEVFFSKEQATDGAVFATPLDRAEAVQSAAKNLLGRPFDNGLSLDDDGKKIYCTELVAIALKEAGVIDSMPKRKIPYLQQEVITPDDLIKNLIELKFN